MHAVRGHSIMLACHGDDHINKILCCNNPVVQVHLFYWFCRIYGLTKIKCFAWRDYGKKICLVADILTFKMAAVQPSHQMLFIMSYSVH